MKYHTLYFGTQDECVLVQLVLMDSALMDRAPGILKDVRGLTVVRSEFDHQLIASGRQLQEYDAAYLRAFADGVVAGAKAQEEMSNG